MDKLYHYTSSATFFKIIKNKSIWLSDLSLANDSKEGKIVLDTVTRLLEKANLNTDQQTYIKESLKIAESTYSCYGFCLTEKPDLLSQWRGYADDGHGFSIGFSKQYFNGLTAIATEGGSSGIQLHKVIYDPEEHEKEISPILNRTIEDIRMVDNSNLTKLAISTITEDSQPARMLRIKSTLTHIPFLQKMHVLKNNAFKEEAEWRLISMSSGFNRENYNTGFRAITDRIIPYMDLRLPNLKNQTITEVYIGPKNLTPINVIESFLDKNGFQNVNVCFSSASYR